MERKERYWVCRPCAYILRRPKSERWRDCPKCREPMTAARKYPYDIWEKRKRQAAKQRKEDRLLEKRHGVPRTCYGYRLRLSPPTRQAWRSLVAAKQRRSFERRATAFIGALREDIWSCPHAHGYQEHRPCDCTGGGMVGAPKIVLVDHDYRSLGRYERGLLAGRYQVLISWDGEHKLGTLIHEVLHYIDDMAKVPERSGTGSHSRAFYQREADLKRQLRYAEEP